MNTAIPEGVGKRIVDALKMQNEIEIVDKSQQVNTETFNMPKEDSENKVTVEENTEDFGFENDYQQPSTASEYQAPKYQAASFDSINNSNVASLNNFIAQQNTSVDFSNIEVPQNVAILKQLISQLPNSISRQAGALVIKQTMEALGISMKSVLQEAQQLQESINLSARECQNSILECKKQINNLELQVQQYQKQSSALNDIISLFVQVN